VIVPLIIFLFASLAPSPWLEVVLERPGAYALSFAYPTRQNDPMNDRQGREVVWRAIDAPRSSDRTLWVAIGTSAARRYLGWCPVHVEVLRHQGEDVRRLAIYDLR